jgi:DNA polymerase-3 subunit epsilon
MKYLFFDTETTGLPINRTSAVMASGIWPNLVSIAWILADEHGIILHSEYHIVKPRSWIIPEESIAIHKITQSIAEKYGMGLNEVIERFMWYVNESDVIVAHNLHFDQNVINNALKWQLGKTLMIEDYKKRLFCTMINGRKIVGIPAKTPGKFKAAKLSEMYKQLFGTEPRGVLHNAMTDTNVLVECFYRIWGTPCELPEIINVLPGFPVIMINDASAAAPFITTIKISFDSSETV